MSILQIETTTRCTLRCPACSRTVFSNKTERPMPHYDLDVDQTYYFLDCAEGKKIKTLNLCGDYGDSIYYPKLFYFLEKFKPDKNIQIVTNGAYRNEKFWKELVSRLDSNDRIVFSIDGWDQESNNLYRVNSDWASTMLGLDIVSKSNIPIIWDTNIFSFNYQHLDKIKKLAESYGAEFLVKKTARFGRDDLVPPKEFINQQEIYFPEYSLKEHKVKIVPDCQNSIRNIICSRNYYWPCGFIRFPLTFYKSKLWKQREHWAIKNKKLDDILANNVKPWVQDILDDPDNVDIVCKMKCKENQQSIVRIDVK